MPNWCSNRWTIIAESEEQAKEIVDLMTNKDEEGSLCVTFNKIIPEPPILSRLVRGGATIDGQKVSVWFRDRHEDGTWTDRLPTEEEQAEIDATGHTDWYDWRISNWGCKWDAGPGDVSHGGEEIVMNFETPWGPPEHVIAALRERFPAASIEAFYDEPGMQSAGYL